MMRILLAVSLIATALHPFAAAAQSPEISLREFASSQIKKGVRSLGMGGNGATWGNYALVWKDAQSALVDGGSTQFTNGNRFTFTAVGAATPALWHGLTVYLLAVAQHASDLRLSTQPLAQGDGANQALFSKIGMPLGRGFSAGLLLSYELSQFNLLDVRYQTRWRPSGGFGVTWQHQDWLLAGIRAVLNHDWESQKASSGVRQGPARSYEGRAGISVLPWGGGLLDVGGNVINRFNGISGIRKVALGLNLGIEQNFFARHFAVRAGLDESAYCGGTSVRWEPVRLDIAYIYNLGASRLGPLFGTTSHSLLATFTFDFSNPLH